jgi:modulator of FtsH protease HflK
MSGNDDSGRKRKNPWGNSNGGDDRGGSRKPPHSPWGGGNGGGGNEPPDFDDVMIKIQNALREVLPSNMNGGATIGLGVLAIFVLWMSSGFFIISPGEHGVIQRFGAWSRTKVDEGLSYHFPAPIETVTKVNVNELKRMEIGFTEAFSRTADSGMKRNVPEESLMLTSDRNIIDLHMVIQWDIKSAEDFLFNIQDQEATIKKVAESAIREVVGQTDMFQVITTGRTSVAAKAKDIIQKNLDEYHSGVNIRQVLIQKAEVHPEVQQAFQDVQSAKQDAEDIKNVAEAYRQDILPKARGQATKILQESEAYKQSQIAKATGDAERFKSVYTAYLGGKDVTKERIYLETMEDVLKNAEKIIMDSKGSNGVVPYLPLDSMGTKNGKSEEGNLKP